MSRRALIMMTMVFAAAAVFANGEGESEGPAPVEVMEGFSSATAAGVNVQWMVDGDDLVVQVSALTTGWVAVGFDPTRMMRDANIIIGYVDGEEVFVRDDFGLGNTRHGSDTANGGTSDISRISGSENERGTRIRFTIPLDSGDSLDRPLAPGTTYTVIVAHGQDGADDFDSYHAARGSLEMEL